MDNAAIDIGAGALGYVRGPDYVDLTLRQAAILAIICDRPGPHRVRDLAAELRVTKPVITRALQAFQRHGMVLCHKEDDRRSIDVEATDAGHAVREAMQVTMEAASGD